MTYSDHDLKEYLTSDCKDRVHPGLCLVEIYLRDPKYFSKLVKQRKISAKAATFCAMYDKQIQDLRNANVDAFFQLKLSFLIDEFLTNTDGVDRITWETFDQYKKGHTPKKENEKIISKENSTRIKKIQDSNLPACEKVSNNITASYGSSGIVMVEKAVNLL